MNVSHNRKLGFTLTELIITISILLLLAALVIPSVRTISKSRQAREAARYVGTAFTAARSQALIDGSSGVWIERHGNIDNASTRIFQVKTPPPFSGYGSDDVAEIMSATATSGTATIPVVNTGTDRLVNVNDFIQFNNRGPKFRITSVTPAGLDTVVTFDIQESDPVLPVLEVPFKVFRRPVRIASTLTELPRGFIIDLELSGHGAENSQFDFSGSVDPIVVTFNENGEVDLIFEGGIENTAGVTSPAGTLFLMVTEFKVDGSLNLNDRNGLWVTVNRNNGMTSIGSMADPTVGTLSQLGNARSLASTGVSANQ